MKEQKNTQYDNLIKALRTAPNYNSGVNDNNKTLEDEAAVAITRLIKENNELRRKVEYAVKLQENATRADQ